MGFTPMEAIVAATKWGGEIMGRPGELGQVKKGYLADLLLVDGDPLADIRILQDRARLVASQGLGKGCALAPSLRILPALRTMQSLIAHW